MKTILIILFAFTSISVFARTKNTDYKQDRKVAPDHKTDGGALCLDGCKNLHVIDSNLQSCSTPSCLNIDGDKKKSGDSTI